MQPSPTRRTALTLHTKDEPCEAKGRTLCPVIAAVGVIGTEWRLAIIHRLLEGPQRFSELLKSNPRLNAKTLSATLKFLEGSGVVQRNVVSTRPFVVVYSLTEMGTGLGPAARGPAPRPSRASSPGSWSTTRCAGPTSNTPPRGCSTTPPSGVQIARVPTVRSQPPRETPPTSPRGTAPRPWRAAGSPTLPLFVPFSCGP